MEFWEKDWGSRNAVGPPELWRRDSLGQSDSDKWAGWGRVTVSPGHRVWPSLKVRALYLGVLAALQKKQNPATGVGDLTVWEGRKAGNAS